ncbi:T9SS type A sorting domain-containing protein [Aureibaculum sp. 2210JD6-5]|uniref:T9SS type A sorting domain-containing protein n=1 Tax=Aureibaculum sp. 2210JD6-5 TaxID=3103957 RepID=UPI002AADA4EA|nr:T9SS type A sorting domain-containing protein [Aureibaculum sp. 2210JD6-5]MDY7395674.1 T9SS type A sorting domain-containing protein [Aureibaculum sp. 2210JD6-5]
MKKKLLFIFLIFPLLVAAQVTNEGEPASWSLTNTKATQTAIILPQLNLKQHRNEDVKNDKIKTKPYRIGISQKVDYGLKNAGSWTALSNGDRIWRISFVSKDALHLSVNFNNFYLPKGSNIYLYNNDKTDLLGAITSTANNAKNELGTWFVKGDKIWVEYYEPKEVIGQGKLNIGAVIHGYRLGKTVQEGYKDKSILKINNSGDCNHDVDCAIGADFEAHRDELKKSVAFMNMGDGFICSGTLINNTAQDKKPYFLSAQHCLERESDNPAANPSIFSMRFNWISPNPVCAAITNSTDAAEELTMLGSTIKAQYSDADMLLLEINNPIPNDWDVTFAGWDRTDFNPTIGVGIHHPEGDIMKIARDDDGPTKATSDGKQLWLIGGIGDGNETGNGWEIGVTEGGSSGSPLFNQNGHIIGQLYGGNALCIGTSDNDEFDLYGRFAIAWNNGATAADRLKDWLDPQETNATTFNSLSNTLKVDDGHFDNNITLYPNPSRGIVNVKLNELTGDLTYEVYNLLGQTLVKEAPINNNTIDLNNFADNIYFIRITEIDTNRSMVKKVVLSK